MDVLTQIHERINHAAMHADRSPSEVTLVAVSKTFAVDAIIPLLEAGQRHFAENRVQEAYAKWPALRESYPDLVLHLVGPLQSNKVAEAVALFDVIHTIDRPKVARAVAVEIQRQGRDIQLFIQVNIGSEPQKAGVAPGETLAFYDQCHDQFGLGIAGFMCIPPYGEDPKKYFQELARLAKASGVTELSMGMSADFETAIACGATHVRVGTAIFGGRA